MCSRVDLHITRSNTSNTFCSETRSLLRERGFTSFSVNSCGLNMTQATFLTPRCYRLVRRIHAHQVWVDARRWAASHLWHKSDFVFQSSRHYLWRHSSTLFLYLTLFAHFQKQRKCFSTRPLPHQWYYSSFSTVVLSYFGHPRFQSATSGAVRHFKCLACCTFRLSFGMSFMGSQTKLLVYSLFCADFGTVTALAH